MIRGQSGQIESGHDFDQDPKINKHWSVANLLVEINEQWPNLKYLGWGFYYAWIWLAYSSNVLLLGEAKTLGNVSVMYLSSTVALTVVLLLCAALWKKATRFLEKRYTTLVAGFFTAISTILVPVSSIYMGNGAIFLIATALTGACTALLALRLGMMYSKLNARQAITNTCISFFIAALLYFVGIGIPEGIGIGFIAIMPVAAAILCTLDSIDVSSGLHEYSGKKLSVSAGMFIRLIIGVAALSVTVGVARGFSATTQSIAAFEYSGSMMVFSSAAAVLLVFFVILLLSRSVDIGRLYYPVILLIVGSFIVVPLLTGGASFDTIIIGVGYTIFILIVWCLLTNIAHRTQLGAVKVFGLGRGASAAGTTLGWLIGSKMYTSQIDSTTLLIVAFILAFILLVVALVVFNESDIGKILSSTTSDMLAEVEQVTFSAEDSQQEEIRPTGKWRQRCDVVADAYGLSPREKEVLVLLAKGNSIERISEELNVSFNTAKSHTRNVYVKLGVHTRQELINLVEKGKAE